MSPRLSRITRGLSEYVNKGVTRLTSRGKNPRSVRLALSPGSSAADRISRSTLHIVEKTTSHPYELEIARIREELENAKATNAALERQVRELTRRAEKAEKSGQTDSLTQLFNRGFFEASLSQAMNETGRNGQPLALIMFDIDHFKSINDTYGHPAGDQVLREIAAAVKNALRASDIPCRYGGEEFAVILRDTSETAAERVAEKIRVAVEGSSILHRGREIKVTISGGFACFNPTDDRDELVGRADQALYAAKEGGRNQVRNAEQLAA